MAVSVGQAAANALARWLRQKLTEDVTVFERWPEADKDLPPKALSILRVGRRIRNDAFGIDISSRVNLSSTTAKVGFHIGGIVQPIQLDIWATSDDERDDILAQLDDVLYRGQAESLAGAVDDQGNPLAIANSDPIRDGLLLQLDPKDGYYGFVDFWFDDATIDDEPDAIQRDEYRARLDGEARMAYTVIADVARLVSATLKVKPHEQATAPAAMQYDTTTLAPNPNPPPAVKVTHGTST